MVSAKSCNSIDRKNYFNNHSNTSVGESVYGKVDSGIRKIHKNNAMSLDFDKPRMVMSIVLLGIICIAIVVMSAYSANLQKTNSAFETKNEFVQAEIDSINMQISEATKIDNIEKTAVSEYGMVYPDASNCITISNTDTEDINLAATIKDEAYN